MPWYLNYTKIILQIWLNRGIAYDALKKKQDPLLKQLLSPLYYCINEG